MWFRNNYVAYAFVVCVLKSTMKNCFLMLSCLKIHIILVLNRLKPQSHQACDQFTIYLRPKNGPIVERTYDWWQRSYDWWQRSWMTARGQISRNKVVVLFKTRSHRAYDQVTTYLRSKNVVMMGQS